MIFKLVLFSDLGYFCMVVKGDEECCERSSSWELRNIFIDKWGWVLVGRMR